MKTFYRFFLFLLPLITLSSCWKDYYLDVEQEVETDECMFSVTAEGGSITIPIRCNTEWYVWNKPHWISFDTESGKGDHDLIAEISRNSSYNRSGNIDIVAGTEVKTITISQSTATSGQLSVTTGDCYAYGTAFKRTVQVFFNISSAHLASEAGVIINNKTYKLDSAPVEGFNSIIVENLVGLHGNCQAYAKNKNTGNIVYGSTKSY